MRGDRLRQVREEKGISQRDLARLCNLAANMIYRYENELSDPTANVLKKIATVLGVSGDYLMGLEDDAHGWVGNGELTEEERVVVQEFRQEGWAGLARLSVEKLTRQGTS